MDYQDILFIAETKLSVENEYVIDEIKSLISSGSTGGEIGSLVGGYLKNLRDSTDPAYLSIASEIDEYLSQFILKTNS